MKKKIFGVLLGLFALLVVLSGSLKGTPIISYVYSNSMEPIIKINDAFLVYPSSNYKSGDIIMYHPIILNAPYITHRIIGETDSGFITKGDNSPYADQDSGEPPVITDRIAGKVFTLHGQPYLLPGFGSLAAKLPSGLSSIARYLSAAFLLFGILALKSKRSARKRKPRHRYRLKHLYRAVSFFAAILIILSIYSGSRVISIKYLVSEYPGSLGDQVEVNKPGQLTLSIKNNGYVPVWTALSVAAPLSIQETPAYIGTRSQKPVLLHVSPIKKTGVYQGYVQIYNYPILLPRSWVLYLHKINPVISILAIGFTFGIYFTVFFRILNRIHGFEDFIPLRTIEDKILKRRIKFLKAKFFRKH